MSGPLYLFTARGIPVFAEIWYFVLLGWFVLRAGDLQYGLIFGICVTVSLLVHEFGHALVASRFRLDPTVVLHGWGGFCVHEHARRDRDDALIIAAGPAAGLLFGLLVLIGSIGALQLDPGFFEARPVAEKFVDVLLYVNIGWSLVNLLPMYPLDGGQLFRLGVNRLVRPARAERIVHGTGLALAIAAAAYATTVSSVFLFVLALFMGWENWQIVSGRKAGPAVRRDPPPAVAPGLLGEARAAWAAGDARETARLCHQIRHEGGGNDEVYELLVIATVALGKHEQALSFARFAPASAGVVEARLEALLALERLDEARALLEAEGARLGSGRDAWERRLGAVAG